MIMPKKYFFDANGDPLAFGKVYTYQAGTTNNKETFTTEDGDVANTNPVILNGEGYASIYISGSYNIVVDDANDVNIWSDDPVSSNIAEEWIGCETPTYISPTSFKISNNLTSVYEPGRRIRINNNVPTFVYGTIKTSSFSGGETTITIYNSIITVSITEVCVSVLGANSRAISLVLSYDTLDDLISDIGNLSIGDVAIIKERTIGHGGGQTIDVVGASTVTPNELNIITGNGSISFVVRPEGDKYYTYHFGITAALSEEDSTYAINTAVEYLDGRTLHLPDNESLKYRGAITHPVCSIIGVRMPEVDSSVSERGALKNGSILVGSLEVNSLEITLKNLGVDAGLDNNSSWAANAVECHVDEINTGLSVTMIDVIGLGRDPNDPFHAIVVAGYKNALIDRVHGIRNYYGFVYKGTHANLGSIIATENGSMGVIIKADNLRGDAKSINVDSIVVDGMGQAGMGVDVEAVGNRVDTINIGKISVDDAVKVFRVVSDGIETGIAVSVNVGQINGRGSSGDAISTIGSGSVLGLNIGQVNLQNITGRAAYFDSGAHLHVNSFIASAAPGNSYYASDFLTIELGMSRTQLGQISLLDQWGGVGEGMINYLNARGVNKLGMHNCEITGVGAPVPINASFNSWPDPLKTYLVSKVRPHTNTFSDTFILDPENVEPKHTMFIDNDTGASLTMQMLDGTALPSLGAGVGSLFVFNGEKYLQQTIQ